MMFTCRLRNFVSVARIVDMVNLISQNAVSKDRADKSKRKADNEPSGIEGAERINDGLVYDLKVVSHRKRKKERKEENKIVEIEQERKMKKLENFLFGSLYSPIEFAKDEDEKDRKEVDDSAAMFFVDRLQIVLCLSMKRIPKYDFYYLRSRLYGIEANIWSTHHPFVVYLICHSKKFTACAK